MATVPARITHCHPIEALRDLCVAFFALFGRHPTQSEATVLWAWLGHESGLFKRMVNNGPAGLKRGSKWKGDVAIHRTHEYVKGQKVPKDEPFRAYPTVYDGCYDALSVLRNGYPEALQGAARGDVEAFVSGLLEGWGRSADYFTAPEPLYRDAVERCLAQLVKLPGIPWAELTSRRVTEIGGAT